MADTKNDPADELLRPASDASEGEGAKRREFVRRAASIGLPVVLASVSNRTVWVQTQITGGGSVPGSAAPSV